MQKHKFASVSLTVQDRAIFVEIFDPQDISANYSVQFSKKFLSPKMTAILNFRILTKNGKTQIWFYFLNRAR